MIRICCSIVIAFIAGGESLPNHGSSNAGADAVTQAGNVCSIAWDSRLDLIRTWLEAENLSTNCPMNRHTYYEGGVLLVNAGLAEKRGDHEYVRIYDLSRCGTSSISSIEFTRPTANNSWTLDLGLEGIAVLLPIGLEIHFDPDGISNSKPTERATETGMHPNRNVPSVYILVLDSVSRASAAAFLPQVMSLIESSGKYQDSLGHRWVNFRKFHTVQHGGTAENMAGLYYGGLILPSSHSSAGPCNLDSQATGISAWDVWYFDWAKATRHFTNTSRHMFTQFREAGFKTGWSGATRVDSTRLRLHPDIDHTLPGFCNTFFASADALNVSEPLVDGSCIGGLSMGSHILEYNERFLRMRRGGPQPHFLYSHLVGGHRGLHGSKLEDHAIALSKMDGALYAHLLAVLALDPPPIVVFMSDHGMMYPECDNKRPFLYIAVPNNIGCNSGPIPKPNWHQLMERYTNTTVTAWDLYSTLRHLLALFRSDCSKEFRDNERGSEEFWGLDVLRGTEGVDLCMPPRRGGAQPFAVDIRRFHPVSFLAERFSLRTTPAQLGIDTWNYDDGSWTHYADCHRNASGVSNIAKNRDAPRESRKCLIANRQARFGLNYLNDYVLQAMMNMPRRTCLFPFTLKAENHILWNSKTGACKVRFTINEGIPPRMFEVSFLACFENVLRLRDSTAALEVVTSLLQITQYDKYVSCSPRGLASLCVCGSDREYFVQQRLESGNCETGHFDWTTCCEMRMRECFDDGFTYKTCCANHISSVSSIVSLMTRAYEALKRKNFDDCLRLCQEVLQHSPEGINNVGETLGDPWFKASNIKAMLGIAYKLKGNLTKAREVYHAAVSEGCDESFKLGWERMDLGKS